MSHELRTPLNAILGFSQIMARDNSTTPSQRESLGIILKSGEHLLNLINDVLDLAKIESGRINIETEDFDLGNLTSELVNMLKVRAEAKGLQLFFDQSSSFPRFIHSDPGKLRQIIINLVGNAIKFTEKGQISLKLSVMSMNHGTKDLKLFFEITDTGPGIAPEDLERIFHPFEQAKSQGKSLTEGTGLGLAITREYVNLLGGSISVTSELGKGSSFHFSIVCQPADADHIPEALQAPGDITAIDNAAKYKILVIEDQSENRLLLKTLLSSFGFQYREAVNGREGLAITQEWLPHIILMDRRMPVMDGMTATREIRKLALAVKPVIIAVTAHAFEEEQKEMLDAGSDAFLRKPFREQDLFELLAKHLNICLHYGKAKEETTCPLTPESFANLTEPQHRQLATALATLDMEMVENSIAEIQGQDPVLARQLKQKADKFAYNDILTLMKTT
jgi:CheY-like chemotaxis protein